jgi:hypothetical protein
MPTLHEASTFNISVVAGIADTGISRNAVENVENKTKYDFICLGSFEKLSRAPTEYLVLSPFDAVIAFGAPNGSLCVSTESIQGSLLTLC